MLFHKSKRTFVLLTYIIVQEVMNVHMEYYKLDSCKNFLLKLSVSYLGIMMATCFLNHLTMFGCHSNYYMNIDESIVKDLSKRKN